MDIQNAGTHNKYLDPFNFTIVPNIVLRTEVSTIEEIILEEELIVSDIASGWINH